MRGDIAIGVEVVVVGRIAQVQCLGCGRAARASRALERDLEKLVRLFAPEEPLRVTTYMDVTQGRCGGSNASEKRQTQ